MLILDDDAASARLIARIATGFGLVARITTTVDDFHAAYQAEVPTVIALDLQLGSQDGVAQIRYLAEMKFPHALILVSGYDRRVLESAASLARHHGLQVAAAFTKPIDLSEFRVTLNDLHRQTALISHGAIEQALSNGEFYLEYQPIVQSDRFSLHKLEALVRWRHPAFGRLAPGRFIGTVEESPALALALTLAVLRLAAIDSTALAKHGHTMPISVNVSPRCLVNPALPELFEQCLRDQGVAPSRICLEITETAAVEDSNQNMEILSRLRLKGMLLALDDFGTGYASLKLLRRMPFSILKIDQTFVADVTDSSESQAIITSIIGMAAALRLEVIAEGVATEAAAVMLRELGVPYLQGYYISRPLPLEALIAWLGARDAQPESGGGADAAAAEPSPEPDDAAPLVSPAGASLSPRQLACLRLLAEGLSIKEIARHLNLSIGTVKTHIALTYSALGAHNRIEALRLAGLPLTAASDDPDDA